MTGFRMSKVHLPRTIRSQPVPANSRVVPKGPLGLLLITAFAVIGLPTSARAATVAYDFAGTIVGTVVSSSQGFTTGGSIGDTFSGTFTYDDSIASVACGVNPTGCAWVNFVTNLSYTLAGQTYTFNPTGSDGSGASSHGGVQQACQGLLSCTVFGFDVAVGAQPGDSSDKTRVAGFGFGSTDPSVFANYSVLPSAIGPLNAFDYQFNVPSTNIYAGPIFDSRLLSTGFVGGTFYGQSYASAVGRITYLQPIPGPSDCSPFPGGGATGGCFPGPGPFPGPIPEPSTYALMLAGLAAVVFAAKRRRVTIAQMAA